MENGEQETKKQVLEKFSAHSKRKFLYLESREQAEQERAL